MDAAWKATLQSLRLEVELILIIWELFGVSFDVVLGPVEVFLMTNEAVPVFGLPELAGLVPMLVDFASREALPTVDDV